STARLRDAAVPRVQRAEACHLERAQGRAEGGRVRPWRRLALGMLSVVAFGVTGEVGLTLVRWDPFFMTTPSHIGAALREQLLGGRLWRDIGVSAEAFVLALRLALLV